MDKQLHTMRLYGTYILLHILKEPKYLVMDEKLYLTYNYGM